ncbi:MAG: thermonuclease family protein [Planctomycetaceae bacterium]|nr:thermonuclease family protein [Planctomycetaceae bacterium]
MPALLLSLLLVTACPSAYGHVPPRDLSINAGWVHAEDSELDILASARGNTVFAWVKNVGNSSVGKIEITVRGKRTCTKTFLIDEGLLPGKKRRFHFPVPASCQLSGAVEIWVSMVDGKKYPPPNPVEDLQLDVTALSERRAFERLPDARVTTFESGDVAVLKLGPDKVRVRLAGLTAPSTPRTSAQQARNAFQDLALGRTLKVRIVGEARQHTLVVLYHKSININERLIRSGAVWYDPRTRKSPTLRSAEAAARRLQRGVWQLPDNQQPSWKSLTETSEKMSAEPTGGTQPVSGTL